MLLKQLFEEEAKTAVIGWGRFNPPTTGHQKLVDKIKEEAGKIKGDAILFLTMTHDSVTTPTGRPTKKEIKNPLTWDEKLPYAQKFFDIDISTNPNLSTLMGVMEYLEKQGYTRVRLVAGSDRVPEYQNIINAYNKTPDKSGKVNFSIDDVEVVNAGMRDPDAEGVEGMSASKLRQFARDDDFASFSQGVPADESTARKLYDAVRNGMGMKKDDSLGEGIDISSSIKSIVATGDSIAKVYGDLKTMAEKWVYNNGTLKGFHRNAAGVGKRWYDTFYWNKMEGDLRTLLEKNPKAAGKLKDFFNIDKDEKGHISFTVMSKSLPQIIYQVGERMDSPELQRFGRSWFKRQKDYEDYLGRVEAEVNDEEDDDFTPAPKQPKDNVVGRQNAAAEDMVNQILRSIDKKAAGEIRNAIAREPNKLQALQRELAKRNIKVGESLKKIKEHLLRELFELTTEYVKLNDGSIVQIQYRPLPNLSPVPGTVQISKADPKAIPNITTVKPLASAGVWQQDAIRKSLASGELKELKNSAEIDEDWRKKLAAAGMAGMIGLSGAAGAADRPSDPQKQPIVATIVIDGETKTLDLTPKGFDDVRDAEKWLDKFLDDRGIVDWRGKIERSPGSQGDGTGRYQRILIQ